MSQLNEKQLFRAGSVSGPGAASSPLCQCKIDPQATPFIRSKCHLSPASDCVLLNYSVGSVCFIKARARVTELIKGLLNVMLNYFIRSFMFNIAGGLSLVKQVISHLFQFVLSTVLSWMILVLWQDLNRLIDWRNLAYVTRVCGFHRRIQLRHFD